MPSPAQNKASRAGTEYAGSFISQYSSQYLTKAPHIRAGHWGLRFVGFDKKDDIQTNAQCTWHL